MIPLDAMRRLTIQDWRLFVEAVMTLVLCRARLRRRDFAETRAWAARREQGHGSAPVSRLAWSIEAAAKRMRGATCLCKALSLQRMLSRNGYESDLVIGVKMNEGDLIAHAWLVHGQCILAGGEEIDSYKTLISPDDGIGSRQCNRRGDDELSSSLQ